MKRFVAAVVMVGLVVSFAGCKKKEEKLQLPPGHPSTEGGMPPAGMPDMPKVDRKVVVPKEVAAKWKAVRLTIENKAAKTSKEYTDSGYPMVNHKIYSYFVMSHHRILR